MIPRAFAGSATGGQIYMLDEGMDDAGVPIPLRAQTNAMAPGGITANHSFDWLRVTFTNTMEAVVLVTPVVDEARVDNAAFSVELPSYATRTSTVWEGLIRATVTAPGGVPRTYAPQGTWLSVLFEVLTLSGGDLIIDSVEVDCDILTPHKARAL
jgi:hypothetical protein